MIIGLSALHLQTGIQRNEALLETLKEKLKNLGFNDLGPLESASLMSMMVNESKSEMNIEQIKAQAVSLDEDLSTEEIESLSRIAESSLNNTSTSANDNITILRPDGQPLEACTKVVVVPIAEKGKYHKSHTLKSGLDSLLSYYNHCQGIVKMGVVLTDIWRPSNINEVEIPLQHFEHKGIKTIFILTSGKITASFNLRGSNSH